MELSKKPFVSIPPILVYIFSLISLSVYSYSQVDLNLTLSSDPIYQSFQQALTQLGYFQRPLSTYIYLGLITSLFISYLWIVWLIKKGVFQFKEILGLIFLTVAILLFAYPAFSYDIFNYIFDTRILIHHQANPWTHRALDFPTDEWTRFMRWTHRTYPYGPLWLVTTIPFYVVGLGKLTLTLLSYKLLATLSYLSSIFAIHHIFKKLKIKDNNYYLALFAFNPLILIESLVSAHLDVVMAGFMLVGIFFIVSSKRILGWGSLIVSVLIKYVSVSVLPFIFLWRQKIIDHQKMFELATLASYLMTFLVITQREVLPWYFIVPFSLTVLIAKKHWLITLMLALTPSLLLRYAPFLYIGDYTEWVYQTRNIANIGTFLLLFPVLSLFQNRFQK